MPEEVPSSAGGGYWREKLYAHSSEYDSDVKFFENALKSAHIEGKMGGRELTFAKGGGLPTLAPLGGGVTVAPNG